MSIFATFNPFYEIRYPRFSTNVHTFVSFLAHVPLIGHKFILDSIKINDFKNRFGFVCSKNHIPLWYIEYIQVIISEYIYNLILFNPIRLFL